MIINGKTLNTAFQESGAKAKEETISRPISSTTTRQKGSVSFEDAYRDWVLFGLLNGLISSDNNISTT